MSLIDEVRTELGSAHLREQVGRVLRISALALAAQVTALGSSHLDRAALASAAVGATEAVYRQFAPTVSWSVVGRALASRLHLPGGTAPAQIAPPTAVTPVSAVPPAVDGPGAGGAA